MAPPANAPYRSSSPSSRPPAEWTYVDEGQFDTARRHAVQVLLLGAVAAAAGAIIGGRCFDAPRTLGLLSFVPFALWAAWRYWRAARGARVVLRLAGGSVEVRRGGRIMSLPLHDLDRVALETKTIHPVLTPRFPAGGIRQPAYANPRDVHRIVLVAGGRRIPLSEDFFGTTVTTDHYDALRSLLRSQGWAPREDPPGAQSALEEEELGEAEASDSAPSTPRSTHLP